MRELPSREPEIHDIGYFAVSETCYCTVLKQRHCKKAIVQQQGIDYILLISTNRFKILQETPRCQSTIVRVRERWEPLESFQKERRDEHLVPTRIVPSFLEEQQHPCQPQ